MALIQSPVIIIINGYFNFTSVLSLQLTYIYTFMHYVMVNYNNYYTVAIYI